MSSSSSYSNSNNNPQKVEADHDVFLSFRGEDTRSGFTSYLYDALVREGIRTFFDDDNLVRGKTISAGLMKAIQGSRSSVVVLSENYAFSSWCLTELCKIVECMDTSGLIVLPIFYHVNPSHVRKVIGSYRDAFKKHENNPKLDFEEVETWRDALKKVGNLAGWTLEETDVEAKFIKDFIAEISSLLDIRKESLHVPPTQSRLQDTSKEQNVINPPIVHSKPMENFIQDVPLILNDTSKEKNTTSTPKRKKKKKIDPTICKSKSILSDPRSPKMLDPSADEDHCHKEFGDIDSRSKALEILKTHFQDRSRPMKNLYVVVYETKIPSWFTILSSEQSISMQVKRNWCDSNLMGLVICVCFRPYPSNTLSCKMRLDNSNIQIGGHRCHPNCTKSNIFRIWMIYLSRDDLLKQSFKNVCGSVEISFHNELLDHGSCFGQCGIRLVYKKDIKELNQINESPNVSASESKSVRYLTAETSSKLSLQKESPNERKRDQSASATILFYGTVIPGNKTPAWFKRKSLGSSMSITLNPSMADNWIGLALSLRFRPYSSVKLFCYMRFRDDTWEVGNVHCVANSERSEHIWLFYLPRSILPPQWVETEGFKHRLRFSFHTAETPNDDNNNDDDNDNSKVTDDGDEPPSIGPCGIGFVYTEDIEKLNHIVNRRYKNRSSFSKKERFSMVVKKHGKTLTR